MKLKPWVQGAKAAVDCWKENFKTGRGPYNEVEPVYAEMAKWISDNGYEPPGTSYEHYYNGPGFPEGEMLTMIVMPLGA